MSSGSWPENSRLWEILGRRSGLDPWEGNGAPWPQNANTQEQRGGSARGEAGRRGLSYRVASQTLQASFEKKHPDVETTSGAPGTVPTKPFSKQKGR